MNNTLAITQTNKCFILEFREQKLYVINHKSLMIHLKSKVGLDNFAIKSVMSMLEHSPTAYINLDHTVRVAS